VAVFDFVLQYPITVTAESEAEAKMRADEWFISIQQALMEADEQLLEKGGVLIVGPAGVVALETKPGEPS